MRERRGSYFYLYTERSAHTPCHPAAAPSPPRSLALSLSPVPRAPRASSQFSRMGTPQEGHGALVATARGWHSPQLHNRRPRRGVHLTSQTHNSLTLCRAKRSTAVALMDTDKWPPRNSARLSRALASTAIANCAIYTEEGGKKEEQEGEKERERKTGSLAVL